MWPEEMLRPGHDAGRLPPLPSAAVRRVTVSMAVGMRFRHEASMAQTPRPASLARFEIRIPP
jgi:hypothetical protein